MDPSRRRCFLEVYSDDADEPRLLQLEPNVKLHNVLDRFDEEGDLYWQDHRLDPEATPLALGMPCGVDEANVLLFMPAATSASYYRDEPSAEWSARRTPLVESTAAMRSSPPSALAAAGEPAPQTQRAPSLPAHFEPGNAAALAEQRTNAAAAPPVAAAVSWYSRPRLLSPALPAVATRASTNDSPRRPSPLTARSTPSRAAKVPREVAGPAAASLSHAQQLYRQQQPPLPPPPEPSVRETVLLQPPPPAPAPPQRAAAAVAPPPDRRLQALVPAAETRRNRPILIDPNVLVDDVGAVETLQSELRQLRREVRGLKHQHEQQRRAMAAAPCSEGRLAVSPSPIPAASTDFSVEELAMELHDKQMHRLYEQRRFYLSGRPMTS